MSSEVDPRGIEAARKAIRYLSHPETPWSDEQVAGVIQAYLSASPSIGRVAYSDEEKRALAMVAHVAIMDKGDEFSAADAKLVLNVLARLEQQAKSTLVYHEEPAGDTQGAAGEMVLVPREPTEAMLSAAMDDLDWWQGPTEVSTSSENAKYDDMSKATIADAYRAMIDAAPAALVSPPDNGEAVAWLCYGGADGKSGKQFVTRGAIDGHVIRPLVDIPLYTRAALQSHNEGSDGVGNDNDGREDSQP